MQLRLPWILSRRRLLVAVFLDSALFVVLYNGLFLHRFGRLPNGSIFLPILWGTWVLSSYVLGRYKGVGGFRTPSGALPIDIDGAANAAGFVNHWMKDLHCK